MQPITLRPPLAATDPADASPLLLVPLANTDDHAKVAPEDYEAVIAAGFSPNWYLHHGRVLSFSRAEGYARVARIILGLAGKGRRGSRVSHVNGDATDLRRKNLTVREVAMTKARYGTDDRRPEAVAGAGWGR